MGKEKLIIQFNPTTSLEFSSIDKVLEMIGLFEKPYSPYDKRPNMKKRDYSRKRHSFTCSTVLPSNDKLIEEMKKYKWIDK